jgi:hypothetical protein
MSTKFISLIEKSNDNNIVIIQNEVEKNVQNKFNKIFLKNNINVDNILNIIIYIMQIIDNYDNIEESTKKLLLINIIRKIVYNYEKSINNCDKIHDFIDYILPSLIDKIILIDKRKIKVSKSIFSKIFNFFKFLK